MMRFAKVLRATLGTRVRTLLVQLRGLGAEGADDAAEAHDNVEVLQPLGLFSRPTIRASLEAVVMELGEELVALLLSDKGAGVMSDVETGETRLYGAKESTCRVRLRADGSIDVEAKSAQAIRITTSGGGNIVLNGGTLDVARKTDPVAGGTLYFVPGTGGAALVYTPPGYSGAPPPGTPIALSGFEVDGGNSTVKA